MYDSKRTVTVLLAAMTVVGFAVAPTAVVAAEDDGLQSDRVTNDTSVQADHGPFPHEVCSDLLGMIHEEAPYDMLVWVDDLPDDAQPPGVPWTVITPSAVAGIVVAVTPNQCDVQDPNDPSWDPSGEGDNLDPDAGGDVQPGEDGEVLFVVNGTLDQNDEGPGADLEADLELAEDGRLNPDATLNDGEKDYGVDPQLQYWSDGTTYFETDVYVFESRLGVEQDCFGEECNFATRGLPNFVDYPALPSHTDREREGGEDGDDGTDGTDGTDDSDDGTGADGGSNDGEDSTGADGSDDGSDGDADGSDDDGEDDGSSGDDGADGDGEGTDTEETDATDDDDEDDEEAGGDADTDANKQQAAADEDQNQAAQEAVAADGAGLGVIVALVVFVLGAAAIAPRD